MTDIDWFGEALKYFGLLVAAGGGTAAVVFGVFQAWGKGWLDSHFDKRLEEFKHEQTKEIERMKLKVNTVFDRSVRIHHLEFEALPSLWEKIFDTYKECNAFINPFRQYADVKRMDQCFLHEFLEERGFSKIDIRTVTEAHDLEKAYIHLIEVQNFNNAKESYNDFRSYFQKKSVLLEQDLKNQVDRFAMLARAALFEQHDNLLDPNIKMDRTHIKAFQDGANSILDQIEVQIRLRLWDATTTQV